MLCHLPYSQPFTEADVHGRYWGRLVGPALGEGHVSYGSIPLKNSMLAVVWSARIAIDEPLR